MSKLSYIFEENIVIQEKIHGSNFRLAYSDDFIMKLLEKDLDIAINDANSIIDEADIPEEGFEILVQMCFQLGKPRVLKFKRFLYHLNKCEFEQSADEMIDSLWYQQTPNRVSELAEIMRNV